MSAHNLDSRSRLYPHNPHSGTVAPSDPRPHRHRNHHPLPRDTTTSSPELLHPGCRRRETGRACRHYGHAPTARLADDIPVGGAAEHPLASSQRPETLEHAPAGQLIADHRVIAPSSSYVPAVLDAYRSSVADAIPSCTARHDSEPSHLLLSFRSPSYLRPELYLPRRRDPPRTTPSSPTSGTQSPVIPRAPLGRHSDGAAVHAGFFRRRHQTAHASVTARLLPAKLLHSEPLSCRLFHSTTTSCEHYPSPANEHLHRLRRAPLVRPTEGPPFTSLSSVGPYVFLPAAVADLHLDHRRSALQHARHPPPTFLSRLPSPPPPFPVVVLRATSAHVRTPPSCASSPLAFTFIPPLSTIKTVCNTIPPHLQFAAYVLHGWEMWREILVMLLVYASMLVSMFDVFVWEAWWICLLGYLLLARCLKMV